MPGCETGPLAIAVRLLGSLRELSILPGFRSYQHQKLTQSNTREEGSGGRGCMKSQQGHRETTHIIAQVGGDRGAGLGIQYENWSGICHSEFICRLGRSQGPLFPPTQLI